MKAFNYTSFRKAIFAITALVSVLTTSVLPLVAQKTAVTPFNFHKGINISAYLSQANLSTSDKLKYFTQTDLQELATLGFDHIRLPFNENQLYSRDGQRNEETFAIIHNVIKWCKEANMRIILDCHQTFDHDFSKFSAITLFKDPTAQTRFEELWKKLCAEFGKYPNDLVAYEILNEPNAADNQSWNIVSGKIIKVIRNLEPERIILLGSNKANRVTTFPDLKIPKNDPNIILSFHFYYPYIITHYKYSGMKSLTNLDVKLNYPGMLISDEELQKLDEEAKKLSEKHAEFFDKKKIQEMILPVVEIAKKAGLRLHCGEFGVNFKYPDRSLLQRYLSDVVSVFKENNIPYTYWGYRKEFGIFTDARKIKDQTILETLTK